MDDARSKPTSESNMGPLPAPDEAQEQVRGVTLRLAQLATRFGANGLWCTQIARRCTLGFLGRDLVFATCTPRYLSCISRGAIRKPLLYPLSYEG